jgi:hypothetical protein
VRDEDRRHADPLLDAFQFHTHVLAQIGVERRKRFVQQQHIGFDDDRAGQRNTLLLTAGQLFRIALADTRQLHEFERILHTFFCSAFGNAAYFRPKATFSAIVLCGNSA